MAEKKPNPPKGPPKSPAKSPPVPVKAPEAPKKKRGCLLYLILFGLLAVVFLASGVAAANYFGVINLQEMKEDMVQEYQLQNYPVIGNYFSPVETNFELTQVQPEPAPAEIIVPPAAPEPLPEVKLPDANTITAEDVMREEKRRQDEQAKRASRLSRLYGEMKPAAAAEVMKEIDDETLLTIFAGMDDRKVAKILALFEAGRAARLTEDMLRGE
ncbi:MAG: hypothetical protein LBR56_08310 [Sporomusaceae bacterium]|jgi:hypothetical protein|nr:hypothetical protein [Sporomusaceae bacterium]